MQDLRWTVGVGQALFKFITFPRHVSCVFHIHSSITRRINNLTIRPCDMSSYMNCESQSVSNSETNISILSEIYRLSVTLNLGLQLSKAVRINVLSGTPNKQILNLR